MIVLNWTIIFCLLVLTAISSILVIGDAHAFSSETGFDVGAAPAVQGSRPPKGGVRLATAPSLPLMAPMRWDDEEGAYMVSLTVGLGSVELVLDTGSSQLSVKGNGCQWRQCDGQGCSLVSCPCGQDVDGNVRTDCSNHYYQPSGARIQPGELGAGMNTVMTYGSQVDTIEHYMDTVSLHLAPSNMTCKDLLSRVPPSSTKSSPATSQRPVIVHRVLHIDGSSSSNLLGLSRPNKGTVEHGSKVLLDALLGGSKVWGVVLMGDSGWLVFGALPCFASPPHYIPLVQPREFSGFLTSFYIVEVESVWVGPDASNLRAIASPPRWCIVDTGTTFTYGSPSFGASLDAAGYVESGSVLRLRLGTKKNPPVELTYTPQQLADPDFPQHSIIQAWRGRTLDDYDSIFPPGAGGVILLGALMMNNHYWEFDLGKQRVGVTPVLV